MLVFVELLALQYNITSNDYFVCWETNSHLRFRVYRYLAAMHAYIYVYKYKYLTTYNYVYINLVSNLTMVPNKVFNLVKNSSSQWIIGDH